MADLAYIGVGATEDFVTRTIFQHTNMIYFSEANHISRLAKCGDVNRIFYPITVMHTNGSHANAIVVDNQQKTVIYIEPHVGANTQWYRDNIERVRVHFPGYTFYHMMNCRKGFQTRETRYHHSCATWILFMGWFLIDHSFEELTQLTDHDTHMGNFCNYVSKLIPTIFIRNIEPGSMSLLYNTNRKLHRDKSPASPCFASIYFRLLVGKISIKEMNLLNFLCMNLSDVDESQYFTDIEINKPKVDWHIISDVFIKMCMKGSQITISHYEMHNCHTISLLQIKFNGYKYVIDTYNHTTTDHLFLEYLYRYLPDASPLPKIASNTTVTWNEQRNRLFNHAKCEGGAHTVKDGEFLGYSWDDVNNLILEIFHCENILDRHNTAPTATYVITPELTDLPSGAKEIVDEVYNNYR